MRIQREFKGRRLESLQSIENIEDLETIDSLENVENLNRLGSKGFRELTETTESTKSIEPKSLDPRNLRKNEHFRKSTKFGGSPDQKKSRASRNYTQPRKSREFKSYRI